MGGCKIGRRRTTTSDRPGLCACRDHLTELGRIEVHFECVLDVSFDVDLLFILPEGLPHKGTAVLLDEGGKRKSVIIVHPVQFAAAE